MLRSDSKIARNEEKSYNFGNDWVLVDGYTIHGISY